MIPMSGNSMQGRSIPTQKYAPYTQREKSLLAELVKGSTVIENKRTDGASLTEKKKAWEKLTNIYNAQPEVSTVRTSDQLKKLWTNLKQRKRKETTEWRHNMLATGGGPMKIQKYDEVLELVEDAAHDVTIDCTYDSTAVFERGIGQTVSGNTGDMTPAACTIYKIDVHESTNNPTTSKAVGVIPQILAEKQRFQEKMDGPKTVEEEIRQIKLEILREELVRIRAASKKAVADEERSGEELEKSQSEKRQALVNLVRVRIRAASTKAVADEERSREELEKSQSEKRQALLN
uniref:Regulatory protein zeste n=1 Tax=Diabrotica virgifera virgifera TaxID=50390 RepID=A0A6P7GI58_DIAVI